jgi:hypothetical protein
MPALFRTTDYPMDGWAEAMKISIQELQEFRSCRMKYSLLLNRFTSKGWRVRDRVRGDFDQNFAANRKSSPPATPELLQLLNAVSVIRAGCLLRLGAGLLRLGACHPQQVREPCSWR